MDKQLIITRNSGQRFTVGFRAFRRYAPVWAAALVDAPKGITLNCFTFTTEVA